MSSANRMSSAHLSPTLPVSRFWTLESDGLSVRTQGSSTRVLQKSIFTHMFSWFWSRPVQTFLDRLQPHRGSWARMHCLQVL